jgi:DNA-binding transcriptional LysR family regulator
MIDSAWLHTFASFAEDANLSRAARRLHLTQPAVHAHIRRLGEEVGAPLYRRQGRGLALTREGVEVAAFARAFAEGERDLKARVGRMEVEQRLVLAAGAGAILYVIGDGLRAATRAGAPPVEIVTADASAAVEAVQSGAAHVGVAALDRAPDDLACHKLTEVDQMLVMPRAHPLARRRRVSVADFAKERLVVPPEGRPHRAALEAAVRAAGAALSVGAVARGWELAIKLVDLGAGLAVVNACCALPRSLAGRPVRELPKVRYVAFTRPKPRPEATDLVRMLVRHAGAWRTR